MAKEAALRKHYDERGLTTQTAHFDKQLREARAQDQASYGSVPVQRNAAVDSCFDDCHAKCMGCCGHDEDNPENNSWCTIL